MNNTRRRAITDLINRANEFGNNFGELVSDLEDIRDEEQDCLDNMPESLEGSDRYCCMEEALQNLEDALEEAQGIVDSIDTMVSCLEDAGV